MIYYGSWQIVANAPIISMSLVLRLPIALYD